MNILVLNAGSSSVKYRLFDMTQTEELLAGIVEEIGKADTARHRYRTLHTSSVENMVALASYDAVFEYILDSVAAHFDIDAVAHRVVHGGEKFTQTTLINKKFLTHLQQLSHLAPLHNPSNIKGIECTSAHLPKVPQVAVFDTAFHRTLPEVAYRYALPDQLYREYGVRRYGFHGISHQYLMGQAAEQLAKPIDALKLITLHLGNGASMAAIDRGRCIDTTMGMTPMEGLVMGSRCGDLDPGVIFHLLNGGFSEHDLESLLNHESGLKGICGDSDMRHIESLAAKGDSQAQLAVAIYCYRIRKYIGAYFTVLQGADALVFSGGVGENSALIRNHICEYLGTLNIAIDQTLNQQNRPGHKRIDAVHSNVAILVIQSDEEREIAHQAYGLLTTLATH